MVFQRFLDTKDSRANNVDIFVNTVKLPLGIHSAHLNLRPFYCKMKQSQSKCQTILLHLPYSSLYHP